MLLLIGLAFTNVPLNFPEDGFLTLDVSLDQTLNDLRALIQNEIRAPAQIQTLIRDGQPMRDNSQTLRQLNIQHNSVLYLHVEQSERQQQRGPPQPRRFDSEPFRQQILNNQVFREQVRQRDPALVEAVSDPESFRNLWIERDLQLKEEHQQAMQANDQINSDSTNPVYQAEILRRIKESVIMKNIEEAFESNPESYGRVHMLYIDVLVNGVPIKAFVDSGAQTTIMSPSAAEKCNIAHLIDERHGGIARGVGTAKILGRVHHALMQFGDYEFAMSFTVMEGKDVDLLLGLDMLKRHRMCIDLSEGCLRVENTRIEFLPEHAIPKMMDEVLENEPKVEGPGGTTTGATTGTVLPGSQAGQSAQALSGPAQSTVPQPQQTQSQATTPAPVPAPAARSQPRAQPQAANQISEDKISTVMQYGGCDRQRAIELLRAAGGNPDMAVALIFG